MNEKLEFIRSMPKVELHLHLEGSIQPKTALSFIKRNNKKNVDSVEDIRSVYKFDDLGEFVKSMRKVTDNVKTLDDLALVTTELLTSLAGQNVRYVEFDCAVQKYMNLGLKLDDVIETIYQASEKVNAKFPIQSRMLVNLQRHHEVDNAVKLVEDLHDLHHPYVVGIGLSGDESKYPQEMFARAFNLSINGSLHRTVHAGEGSGPKSVWNAIKLLHAERIDHGTRSIEDDKLMDYLVEQQIPLTQCISSNVKLHIVENYEQHPFRLLYDKGVKVTLNTDDPQVFGVSITDEFVKAAELFNLEYNDLRQIVLNSVHASFLNEDEKNNLEQSIKNEFAALLQSKI